MALPVPHPNGGQEFPGTILALPSGDSAVEKGHFNIFESRGPGDQLEVLEDKSDGAIAKDGSLGGAENINPTVSEVKLAAGGPVEETHEVEKCGFSRSGAPNDRDGLSPSDGQGNSPKGWEFFSRNGIDLGDGLESEREPGAVVVYHGRGRFRFIGFF